LDVRTVCSSRLRQHAREWISAEVTRRGYQYFLEHATDGASGIPAILASTET
jgi:hypothetical protein